MLIKHFRLVSLALLILVIVYCCVYTQSTAARESTVVETTMTK